MNMMDECWNNQSLLNSSTACNANSKCQVAWHGGCEPKCLSQGNQSQSACNDVSGCKWVSGWCNPSSVTEIFSEVQSGALLTLGTDACPESGMQPSADICGFGMKDMGDAYGLGAGVFNFTNSSVCNKEKIGNSTTLFGAGNDTTEMIVYLDTDGSSSGGCSLVHNSSSKGYEFRLRYSSEWNATLAKAIESFGAYKCDNSKWIASDIKLSVWKKIMCSDVKGPMIAIKKTELSRFPKLYDSTKDMRVYVTTVGNSGNISSPTDTAEPAYITLGSVDFEIVGSSEYGADSAKFEGILHLNSKSSDGRKKTAVEKNDCFSRNCC